MCRSQHSTSITSILPALQAFKLYYASVHELPRYTVFTPQKSRPIIVHFHMSSDDAFCENIFSLNIFNEKIICCWIGYSTRNNK